MYKITIFNANESYSNPKVAYSPYNDKTFIFNSFEIDSLKTFYNYLATDFVLNIPLQNKEKIKTLRRKSTLQKFLVQDINYIILDIDNLKSNSERNKVLDFFKPYKCVIGASKSNSEKNYNLKGILEIQKSELKDFNIIVLNLNNELKKVLSNAELDLAVSRITTFNAPTYKNQIFLDNSNLNNIYIPNISKKEIQTIIDIQDIQTSQNKISVDLSSINAPDLEKYCLRVFETLGFICKGPYKNGFRFSHPVENKSKDGFLWQYDNPFLMFHYNSQRSISIYDLVKKLPNFKKLSTKIDYDDTFIHFDFNTEVLETNERYLNYKDFEKDIHNFLEQKGGLFSIKSPMGTAKSNIIKFIIDEALEMDYRVLLVTNRISVAQDFKTKYNLKIYSENNYNPNDSLIVQFDSLWKYNIDNFDLVIMDEFISLMCHSRSDLDTPVLSLIKFLNLFDKKLVIADAFLTGYENFLLKDKFLENTYQLNNLYRDKTPLLLYENSNFFSSQILKYAKNGKISVSGTSLNFLKSLKIALEKQNLRVFLLTSETSDEMREHIYKCFNDYNDNSYDCVLYSSTLTVGVSNLNNILAHFHYDSGMATDVISSIQMLKRSRRAKSIHLFVRNTKNVVQIDYEKLKQEYLRTLTKKSDLSFLFEYNDYNEPRLSVYGEKIVKIDCFKNILSFSHRDGMLFLLKYHFGTDPVVIDKASSESLILSGTEIKKIEKNKKIDEISKIFTDPKLRNIDPNFYKIKDKVNINTKKEILEICLTDKMFIDKCIVYNLYKINKDELTKKYISLWTIQGKNFKLLEKLLNGNIDILLKSSKLENLRDSENLSPVEKKEILLQSGIKKKEIDSNILKYAKYIKFDTFKDT